MVHWRSGSFSFVPEIQQAVEHPMAKADPGFVIMDAMREMDEMGQLAPKLPQPEARISAIASAAAAGDLEGLARDLFVACAATPTYRELLDRHPQTDAQISQALVTLREQGLVAFS
jgi:hypothetical protein